MLHLISWGKKGSQSFAIPKYEFRILKESSSSNATEEWRNPVKGGLLAILSEQTARM